MANTDNERKYAETYGKFPMLIDLSIGEVALEARMAQAPTGEIYKLVSKFCEIPKTIVYSHWIEYPEGFRGKVKTVICETGKEYLEHIAMIEHVMRGITSCNISLQLVKKAFYDLTGKYIGGDE